MAYDYEAGYANVVKQLTKRAQAAIDRIMPDVYIDWLKFIEESIKDIFREAVDAFYDDYDPGEYKRKKSMYNLLKIKRNDKAHTLHMEFEPSDMTHFRNGYSGDDGLYDQVFEKGWHGGADKGDITRINDGGEVMEISTPHPSPGTPYWRSGPGFLHWGAPAAVAEISPHENYTQKLNEYQVSQDGIYADYYKAWNLNKHKLNLNL